MTEPGGGAWRQASYHPFALTSWYGRGHGAAVATPVVRMWICGRCRLCLPPPTRPDLGRRSGRGEHAVVTGPRGPEDARRPNLDGGRLQAVLPPLSWNMIRLRWQRPARRCMSF